MSEGMLLMAAGVTLGAVAALSLTRLLGDLLYKTSPRDPLAFAIAFGVITLVSVAAQQGLFEALVDRQGNLGEWYRAAVAVINDDSLPDRLSLAAHARCAS